MNRKLILGLLLCFLIPALTGCVNSAGYGRYKPAGNDMSIDHLVKNAKNYNVYWAGVNVRNVNAIFFDPKDDDLNFAPQNSWQPVQDGAELSELMRWINVFKMEGPTVYTVIGPGARTFGYLYMLPTEPLVSALDERTLTISNITLRVFDEQGF